MSHASLYDTISDHNINAANTLDFSYMDLQHSDVHLQQSLDKFGCASVRSILLNNNLLDILSQNLFQFQNLIKLDISNNNLSYIQDDLCLLKNLKIFIAKDNLFDDTAIPKALSTDLCKLEVINLSGNRLTQFPYQLLEMETLKEIYLGGNKIVTLPKDYERLRNLEILYLGGNRIGNIPEELSQMYNLKSLNLSFNCIHVLPTRLAKLKRLNHLALHNNNITTLPIELVKLNLVELSLRNNPLVSRFIKDLNYNVPTLLELSGRIVKTKQIYYDNSVLPGHLVSYLNSSHQCLNPKCRGVYFTSKIEHIKFVDFCGKYRVPLMQYLCSPKCNQPRTGSASSDISDQSSDSECEDAIDKVKLKKILLG